MIRRPPRSTLLTHSFPTRRSSDLLLGRDEQLGRSIGMRDEERQRHRCMIDILPADVEQPGNRIERRNHRRSEEHTSELQSLMRISYAVFCLKKKIKKKTRNKEQTRTTNNKSTITHNTVIQS